MATKIRFRKGNSVPLLESLSVGEPLWDVDNARLGIGNGEQQPRWYPKIRLDGGLTLNTGTGIYSPTDDDTKIDFLDAMFRIYSNNTKIADFNTAETNLNSLLTRVNGDLELPVGGITAPGFTVLRNGTVRITSNLELLGTFNLSLSAFASGVLPTSFASGDILVAGTPHTWKNPKEILVNSQFTHVLGRALGRTENLRLRFAEAGYWSTNNSGIGVISNLLTEYLAAVSGSYTRNSIGTHFDKKGLLQTALANIPRLDFDPYTGESLGLLIEGSSKNFIDNSNDTSTWASTNVSLVTAANTAWTNRGLPNPTLLTETTDNTAHSIAKVIAGMTETLPVAFSTFIELPAGSTRTTIALIVEGLDGSNRFGKHFNLSTMTTGNNIVLGNGAVVNASVRRISTKVYRIGITGTVNASTGAALASLRFIILGTAALNGALTYAGLGGSMCRVGSFQMEIYDKVTSLIPTTGTAITRQADRLSIPVTAFGFDNEVGTVTIEFRARAVYSLNSPILMLRTPDIGTNHELKINATAEPELNIRDGGALLFTNIFTGFVPESLNRFSWEYLKAGTVVAGNNGVASAATAIDTVPTGVDQLLIGVNSDNTKYLDGWVSSVSYTNKKLPTSQL